MSFCLSIVAILAAGCEMPDAGLESVNRRMRHELKQLEQQVAELQCRSITLARAVEASTVAAELMEGVRRQPPSTQVRLRSVYEDAVVDPVKFDGETAARDHHVWLPQLIPGRNYRFECEIEASLEGERGAKFGGMLKLPDGRMNWPTANDRGRGVTGRRNLEFRFFLPPGGKFMLMYGPNGLRGSCTFRNIRGYVEEGGGE